MKTGIKLIVAFLAISIGLCGQGVDDALYHMQTRYEGTARSMAMGGATGAMGGDLTSVCINPAGLGLYRASEVAFSTGLQNVNTLSSYYGNDQSNYNLRLSIPNLGYVMTSRASNYKPLRYVQFAITLNRTNDFSYRSIASGINPNSSMVDAYLQAANGNSDLLTSFNPSSYLADNYPYDLSPAWETYLIDRYVDSTGSRFFDSPVPPGNVNQKDVVSCRGRSEEWAFAVAGNYYDKLFVGASLGLTHLKRISKRDYTETSLDGSFDNWTHREELADTAWGVNAKCGVIYYPTPWLRIGAAWHLRTLSSIGEVWSTETATKLNNSGYHKYLSPSLYQTYEFRSPHSFTGSIAFILPSTAMITADVDYLNYGNSKFKSDDFDFSEVNDDIRDILKPSFNIRLGMEWRFRQYFFRSGAAYYGSPYGFGEKYGSTKKMAVGIGYTTENDFIWDFTYELSGGLRGYTPYQYYVDGENIVDDIVQRQWRSKVVATVRMKIN